MNISSLIKSIALIIIFLYIPFAGISQKTGYTDGYIITNTDDTLYGEVKIREEFPFLIREDVKFKKADGSKTQSFYANEIKGFYSGVDTYVSREYGKKKRKYFFRTAIKGYLSYYLAEMGSTYFNNISTSYVILQKQGEPEFEPGGGKNRMMAYFKDAPTICYKIRNGLYGSIETMVKEYNKLHPLTN